MQQLSDDIPELRVLYMSGYSSDADLSRLRDDERVGLLRKPFAPSVLLAEVRKTLDVSVGEPKR